MYTDHYNILLTPSNNLFCQTLVVMMSAIEICEKKVNFYIMESDWSMELKRACSEWIKIRKNIWMSLYICKKSKTKEFSWETYSCVCEV